ncbi:hypothetical protein GLOIN_2v1670903, partial [Rhizophagus irregularis DAOM 181602=DAOM 197198]
NTDILSFQLKSFIIFIYPMIKIAFFCILENYNTFFCIWILRYSIYIKNITSFIY